MATLRSRLFLAGMLASVSALGFSQNSSGTVKFENVNGHIFIQAKINGQPVRLAVDTGAGMNALMPEVAKRLGIKEKQKVNAQGVGSSTVQAFIGSANSLEVGTSISKDEPVVVIPLPAELGCDGLVGFNFLSHFITTIDYDKSTISFQKPTDFKPNLRAIVLPIEIKSGIPEVDGSVEGIKGRFSLDTGANGQLAIFGPFTESNGLRAKFPNRVSAVTGAGVGGLTMGDVVRMKTVKLGEILIPPLVVSLSNQTKGVFSSKERIGNVSSDILSRFVVTFDYPGKRLYLTKGAQFNKPSDFNRTGFMVMYEDAKPKVVWIIPNSPADKVGIKVGDVIEAVNGKAITEIRPADFRAMLKAPTGTKMKLKLERGSEVELTLRELLG